jgi:hypothetical protein
MCRVDGKQNCSFNYTYSDVTALTVLYITKDSETKVGNLNLNVQKTQIYKQKYDIILVSPEYIRSIDVIIF